MKKFRLRKGFYWFLKRKFFHVSEGEELPATLKIIKFILSPVRSIGQIAERSVYCFDRDEIIFDHCRISFEELNLLFNSGEGVFVKEGHTFRKLPPSAFCTKIYNFEPHPFARLDATWDGREV